MYDILIMNMILCTQYETDKSSFFTWVDPAYVHIVSVLTLKQLLTQPWIENRKLLLSHFNRWGRLYFLDDHHIHYQGKTFKSKFLKWALLDNINVIKVGDVASCLRYITTTTDASYSVIISIIQMSTLRKTSK